MPQAALTPEDYARARRILMRRDPVLGAAIKAIGAAARKEIGDILEQKVHLFLFVKGREDWGNDPDRYREIGLEFPKE